MAMLERLHLTEGQWRRIGKWSSYTILFIVTMMIQTVCLGNAPILGVQLSFLPILVCCVCLREKPESGGIFALWMSCLWCLSGADYGSVSILVWTAVGMGLSILCQIWINGRILTCALCCLLMSFANETVIFLGKNMFDGVPSRYFLSKTLPCVALSMVAFPVFYWLVKRISRIGGSYGA